MVLTTHRQSNMAFQHNVQDYGALGSIDEYFEGAIIALDSNGFAVPGADTAAFTFAGIALESLSQTAAVTDGDNDIRVFGFGSGMTFQLPIVTGITVANIGEAVFIADDESVDLAAGVANNIAVGTIVAVVDANTVWVRI